MDCLLTSSDTCRASRRYGDKPAVFDTSVGGLSWARIFVMALSTRAQRGWRSMPAKGHLNQPWLATKALRPPPRRHIAENCQVHSHFDKGLAD